VYILKEKESGKAREEVWDLKGNDGGKGATTTRERGRPKRSSHNNRGPDDVKKM